MNLLSQLLNEVRPFQLPTQHVRKIRDPDMPRTEDKAEKETKPPKRGSAYGTVQPAILTYLKTVKNAQADQIALAINIHVDSVRRSMRALAKAKKIVCVRPAVEGKWRRAALWKAADNV